MTIAEKIPPAVPAEERTEQREWLQAVEALVTEVTKWSHSQGWRTAARTKRVMDESLQKEYTMPVLDIITEREYRGLSREVKLVVEPVFFDTARGIGRVDFYVWPAMYRVRLLHKTGRAEWSAKTDSHVNWPLPWNQESFVLIAEGLLGD